MKRLTLLWLCLGTCFAVPNVVTLEQIAADKSLWPREVTVSVAHEVPVIVDGKASGSMQAGAGRKYPVTSVGDGKVTVNAQGAAITFPAEDTNVLALAEELQARQAALAAATPVPARSTPTPTPVPTPAPATNVMAEKLDGILVTFNGEKYEDFDSSQLGQKKYLAVYFSASWCPPCRGFTPELVKMYKRQKGARDLFDVIYVSNDRDEDSMTGYMKDDKMEWPAIEFKKIKKNPLAQYGGKGIPRLVLIDENGTVISDSYEGDKYVGPTKVMKELEKLIKGS